VTQLRRLRGGKRPLAELLHDQYRCVRCGIVQRFNVKRDRPEFCKECMRYASDYGVAS
jgi:hypothetical protein